MYVDTNQVSVKWSPKVRCPPCCVETWVQFRVLPFSSRYVPPPAAVRSTRDGMETSLLLAHRCSTVWLCQPHPDSVTSHPYFNHSPIPIRFAGSVSRDTERHLLSPTSKTLAHSHENCRLSPAHPQPIGCSSDPTRIAGSLRRTTSLSDAPSTQGYRVQPCRRGPAHQTPEDWMEGEEGRKGCSLFLAGPSQPSSTPATPDHRRVEFGSFHMTRIVSMPYIIRLAWLVSQPLVIVMLEGVFKFMQTGEFATSSCCTIEVLVKVFFKPCLSRVCNTQRCT